LAGDFTLLQTFVANARNVSLLPSPETAAPFPQRWGLLRKGRAVFRREDLRFEKLIV
jgi:hypothetical protein